MHNKKGNMPIKRSQTGGRVLKVLEAIATHQPIGTRALARLLAEDKSAIHRAIMTLADDGWIQVTAAPPMRWEVSPRILAVADKAYGGYDLIRRARSSLERLRQDCGETVALMVPDVTNLVVADVVESPQLLRVVPAIGDTVGAENTAAGRSILPLLTPDRQVELLGGSPSEALLEIYATARARGYAISEGESTAGVTSIGAPIIEFDGRPCGAVVAIGPSERLHADTHAEIGKQVAQTARSLSRGVI